MCLLREETFSDSPGTLWDQLSPEQTTSRIMEVDPVSNKNMFHYMSEGTWDAKARQMIARGVAAILRANSVRKLVPRAVVKKGLAHALTSAKAHVRMHGGGVFLHRHATPRPSEMTVLDIATHRRLVACTNCILKILE